MVHHLNLLAGKVPDEVSALQPEVPDWVTAFPPSPVIPYKKSPLDPLSLEEAMADIFNV